MFIAVPFTIAKCWKQPRCPSVNEWIKKLWNIYRMEFYAAERKKELLPFVMANVALDGTGEHYAKRNKPGGERQIPYDLTFNRNLINITNKEENMTKDTEIENRPTVTRGERGGNFRGKG